MITATRIAADMQEPQDCVRHADSQDQAVLFGSERHLMGVYRGGSSGLTDYAVLMLTAGMLPSSGPFRLHVDLANALSQQGISSLRFDLSGIGESLGIGAHGSSLERAAAEISSAIDWLAERGVERCAVFGLCSGADDALYAASKDPRIVGLFAVDGCGYRTPRFYWHRWLGYYLPKLCSARKWRQKLRSWLGQATSTARTMPMGFDIREFPVREIAVEQLLGLETRGVRMHFHYTGGVDAYYNHAAQFRKMFPELRSPLTTSSFAPHSDHTAFLCEHRTELVELAADIFAQISHKLPSRPKAAEGARAH